MLDLTLIEACWKRTSIIDKVQRQKGVGRGAVSLAEGDMMGAFQEVQDGLKALQIRVVDLIIGERLKREMGSHRKFAELSLTLGLQANQLLWANTWHKKSKWPVCDPYGQSDQKDELGRPRPQRLEDAYLGQCHRWHHNVS